jgi:hypothetical protein
MNTKYKKLILSILFDAVGFIPFIDLIWAPISAYLMQKMYKSKEGKFASFISFVEELFPFSDVIPTFTLMWIYTHLIKAKSTEVTFAT